LYEINLSTSQHQPSSIDHDTQVIDETATNHKQSSRSQVLLVVHAYVVGLSRLPQLYPKDARLFFAKDRYIQKMTAPLNYYDVLQVSEEASLEEIKSSFRRLALEKHPDKQTADASSEEEFRQIHAAWECLRDSREAYDEELRRKANCAQSRLDSAMMVKLSEMEEAIDDETNKVVYIYSCRCRDEIELWPDVQPYD
jgi:hypothetical protein